MKKIFTTILALATVFSMSVTVFAAEGSDTGNKPGESQSIDVTVKAERSTSTETTYSVDIIWESMTFTYSESGTKVWDPVTHTYTTSTTSGWDKTEADITVTNHSNVAVNTTVSYAPVEGNGINGSIENESKTLAQGAENKPNEADSLVATLIISGTPDESVTVNGAVVGQITVTIAPSTTLGDEGENASNAVNAATVSDEEGLNAAIAAGGNIKLDSNITLESKLTVSNDVNIDLNGYELSASNDYPVYISSGADVKLSNGTIMGAGTAVENHGTLDIQNCTLNADTLSLNNSGGTSTVSDSNLNGVVACYEGTVSLADDVTLGSSVSDSTKFGITSQGGTVVCRFDPTDCLYGDNTVVNNGNGTWTVTEA